MKVLDVKGNLEAENEFSGKWKGYITASLGAPLDRTWHIGSDFSGLHKFVPIVEVCERLKGCNREAGCLRFYTMDSATGLPGGKRKAWAKDRLVNIEEETHSYTYAVEGSNMNLENCEVSFKASDGKDGTTVVKWSWEVDPVQKSTREKTLSDMSELGCTFIKGVEAAAATDPIDYEFEGAPFHALSDDDNDDEEEAPESNPHTISLMKSRLDSLTRSLSEMSHKLEEGPIPYQHELEGLKSALVAGRLSLVSHMSSYVDDLCAGPSKSYGSNDSFKISRLNAEDYVFFNDRSEEAEASTNRMNLNERRRKRGHIQPQNMRLTAKGKAKALGSECDESAVTCSKIASEEDMREDMDYASLCAYGAFQDFSNQFQSDLRDDISHQLECVEDQLDAVGREMQEVMTAEVKERSVECLPSPLVDCGSVLKESTVKNVQNPPSEPEVRGSGVKERTVKSVQNPQSQHEDCGSGLKERRVESLQNPENQLEDRGSDPDFTKTCQTVRAPTQDDLGRPFEAPGAKVARSPAPQAPQGSCEDFGAWELNTLRSQRLQGTSQGLDSIRFRSSQMYQDLLQDEMCRDLGRLSKLPRTDMAKDMPLKFEPTGSAAEAGVLLSKTGLRNSDNSQETAAKEGGTLQSCDNKSSQMWGAMEKHYGEPTFLSDLQDQSLIVNGSAQVYVAGESGLDFKKVEDRPKGWDHRGSKMCCTAQHLQADLIALQGAVNEVPGVYSQNGGGGDSNRPDLFQGPHRLPHEIWPDFSGQSGSLVNVENQSLCESSVRFATEGVIQTDEIAVPLVEGFPTSQHGYNSQTAGPGSEALRPSPASGKGQDIVPDLKFLPQSLKNYQKFLHLTSLPPNFLIGGEPMRQTGISTCRPEGSSAVGSRTPVTSSSLPPQGIPFEHGIEDLNSSQFRESSPTQNFHNIMLESPQPTGSSFAPNLGGIFSSLGTEIAPGVFHSRQGKQTRVIVNIPENFEDVDEKKGLEISLHRKNEIYREFALLGIEKPPTEDKILDDFALARSKNQRASSQMRIFGNNGTEQRNLPLQQPDYADGKVWEPQAGLLTSVEGSRSKRENVDSSDAKFLSGESVRFPPVPAESAETEFYSVQMAQHAPYAQSLGDKNVAYASDAQHLTGQTPGSPECSQGCTKVETCKTLDSQGLEMTSQELASEDYDKGTSLQFLVVDLNRAQGLPFAAGLSPNQQASEMPKRESMVQGLGRVTSHAQQSNSLRAKTKPESLSSTQRSSYDIGCSDDNISPLSLVEDLWQGSAPFVCRKSYREQESQTEMLDEYSPCFSCGPGIGQISQARPLRRKPRKAARHSCPTSQTHMLMQQEPPKSLILMESAANAIVGNPSSKTYGGAEFTQEFDAPVSRRSSSSQTAQGKNRPELVEGMRFENQLDSLRRILNNLPHHFKDSVSTLDQPLKSVSKQFEGMPSRSHEASVVQILQNMPQVCEDTGISKVTGPRNMAMDFKSIRPRQSRGLSAILGQMPQTDVQIPRSRRHSKIEIPNNLTSNASMESKKSHALSHILDGRPQELDACKSSQSQMSVNGEAIMTSRKAHALSAILKGMPQDLDDNVSQNLGKALSYMPDHVVQESMPRKTHALSAILNGMPQDLDLRTSQFLRSPQSNVHGDMAQQAELTESDGTLREMPQELDFKESKSPHTSQSYMHEESEDKELGMIGPVKAKLEKMPQKLDVEKPQSRRNSQLCLLNDMEQQSGAGADALGAILNDIPHHWERQESEGCQNSQIKVHDTMPSKFGVLSLRENGALFDTLDDKPKQCDEKQSGSFFDSSTQTDMIEQPEFGMWGPRSNWNSQTQSQMVDQSDLIGSGGQEVQGPKLERFRTRQNTQMLDSMVRVVEFMEDQNSYSDMLDNMVQQDIVDSERLRKYESGKLKGKLQETEFDCLQSRESIQMLDAMLNVLDFNSDNRVYNEWLDEVGRDFGGNAFRSRQNSQTDTLSLKSEVGEPQFREDSAANFLASVSQQILHEFSARRNSQSQGLEQSEGSSFREDSAANFLTELSQQILEEFSDRRSSQSHTPEQSEGGEPKLCENSAIKFLNAVSEQVLQEFKNRRSSHSHSPDQSDGGEPSVRENSAINFLSSLRGEIIQRSHQNSAYGVQDPSHQNVYVETLKSVPQVSVDVEAAKGQSFLTVRSNEQPEGGEPRIGLKSQSRILGSMAEFVESRSRKNSESQIQNNLPQSMGVRSSQKNSQIEVLNEMLQDLEATVSRSRQNSQTHSLNDILSHEFETGSRSRRTSGTQIPSNVPKTFDDSSQAVISEESTSLVPKTNQKLVTDMSSSVPAMTGMSVSGNRQSSIYSYGSTSHSRGSYQGTEGSESSRHSCDLISQPEIASNISLKPEEKESLGDQDSQMQKAEQGHLESAPGGCQPRSGLWNQNVDEIIKDFISGGSTTSQRSGSQVVRDIPQDFESERLTVVRIAQDKHWIYVTEFAEKCKRFQGHSYFVGVISLTERVCF